MKIKTLLNFTKTTLKNYWKLIKLIELNWKRWIKLIIPRCNRSSRNWICVIWKLKLRGMKPGPKAEKSQKFNDLKLKIEELSIVNWEPSSRDVIPLKNPASFFFFWNWERWFGFSIQKQESEWFLWGFVEWNRGHHHESNYLREEREIREG